MDLQDLWNEVLDHIHDELDQSEFDFWFSNVTYLSGSKDSLTLEVPSSYFIENIKAKYHEKLVFLLKEISGFPMDLEYKPRTTLEKKNKNRFTSTLMEESLDDSPPLLEKESFSRDSENQEKPTSASVIPNTKKHPQLNENFNFDSFVIGENTYAFNAALAVAKNPGHTHYNPYVIFGGVGLGKTHLLQSIGNYIHRNSNQKVIYLAAETFTNEFVNSIRENSIADFKNRYRNVDVLLLDDIHDFEKKEKVQEELFHTYNTLYQGKKQMVFTCDRPPTELKSFTERLRSRFQLAMSADMLMPGWETRTAILQKKAESRHVNIPTEVIDYIARNVTSNIRDLEGSLNQIINISSLVNQKITLEMAQYHLKNIIAGALQQSISMDQVIRVVADHYKLSPSELKSKKRNQTIAFPRQVAMYIIRELTEYSTTEVGIEFGGRDHTTVMHSVQKIEDFLKKDPKLEPLILSLTRTVKESRTNP